MTWSKLLEFMCTRNPKFGNNIIGVPQQVIATIEDNFAVMFPQLYVDFLMSVGEDPDRYMPFGGHDTDFYELSKLLVDVRYPNQKYWRITRHIDTSVDVHEEIFLDLTRKNGDDTPLVTFDVGHLPFEPDYVNDLDITLKEALVNAAFSIFELATRSEQASISCSCESAEESLAMSDAIVVRFGEMGLRELLPSTTRSRCFGDEERAALIEIYSETLVTVALTTDNQCELELGIEQLLAVLPDDAKVSTG